MSGHYIERWECGHVASQCRCPGPKEERTRPGKCSTCAAQVSAMPGRSDLSVDQYRLTGGAADPERETRLWSLWVQRALDAESALLAAEARVLEVEQERDDHRRAAIDNLAWGKMAEADMATLRAERDALVPLARAGLNAYDYVLAKEQYGNATVPLLDRVSIDESLSAARAILDREGT